METGICNKTKEERKENETCKQWILARNKYVITNKKYMVCSTCANWTNHRIKHTEEIE